MSSVQQSIVVDGPLTDSRLEVIRATGKVQDPGRKSPQPPRQWAFPPEGGEEA
jgi:hypothetical protein